MLPRATLVACIAVSLSLFPLRSVAEEGPAARGRWTVQKAQAWGDEQPWLVGSNFIPSTAINQLEMFQAETFDPETIDRELGLAAGLGFNTVRVFLHDLLWQQDSEGFLSRIDEFLTLADKHGIRTMLVLFDGVWDPQPKLGKQPEPRPRVHNSGWVQSPGAELLGTPARHDELEPYVRGVVGHFRSDPRVLAWDLFNEPDNGNQASYRQQETKRKPALVLALMQKALSWAREMDPEQPITMGVWRHKWNNKVSRFMLDESDVVSFHNYAGADDIRTRILELQELGRPILCTEYMARPTGSTFEEVLPVLKKHRVGAYNWGLVEGKTQTIYPWDSWSKTYTDEPPVWHHDIFRRDGTPYRQEEVDFIRSLTSK